MFIGATVDVPNGGASGFCGSLGVAILPLEATVAGRATARLAVVHELRRPAYPRAKVAALRSTIPMVIMVATKPPVVAPD